MSQLPPYRNAGDALRRWDIPEDPSRNHVFHKHTQKMLARIRVTKPGEGAFPSYRQTWVRIHADRPAPTVMGAHGGVFIHPWLDRCVSPRELAVLQDFPDDYVFIGSKSENLSCVGNAVPIGLGRAIGMACRQMLDEAAATDAPAPDTCASVVTADNPGTATHSHLVFSWTPKMPGPSWGIPVTECLLGSKLRLVPGTVCQSCYASRNNYCYPGVKKLRQDHLRQMREPRWVEQMAQKILTEKIEWFRWFDSGDLQDVAMLANIVAIARATPSTRFWLPTRELCIVADYVQAHCQGVSADVIWPENLVVRLSGNMVDGAAPTGFAHRFGCTVSRVVSTEDYTCTAPKNDGKCGDCRQCWQNSDFEVVYHFLRPGAPQREKKTPAPLPPYRTMYNAIGGMPASLPALAGNRANPESALALPNHEYFIGGYSSRYIARNHVRGWDELSFTILASGRHAQQHPSVGMEYVSRDEWRFTTESRRLSVHECARIQTFPDSYRFCYKNVDDGYKMVGNSVPVLLARAIGVACAKILDEGVAS